MDAQHHEVGDARAGGSDSRSEGHEVVGFALALWNGRDPVLRQHRVGLAMGDGHHATDVKEYRVFLNTMKARAYVQYRYAYPFDDDAPVDADAIDGASSWEVLVEYAQLAHDDVLIALTLANRGRRRATLHVLPTISCRAVGASGTGARHALRRQLAANRAASVIEVWHPVLGQRYVYATDAAGLLFIDDETALTEYIVRGRRDVLNPERRATSAVVHYMVTLGAGESATRRLRLTAVAPRAQTAEPLGASFDAFMAACRRKVDDFQASVTRSSLAAVAPSR